MRRGSNTKVAKAMTAETKGTVEVDAYRNRLIGRKLLYGGKVAEVVKAANAFQREFQKDVEDIVRDLPEESIRVESGDATLGGFQQGVFVECWLYLKGWGEKKVQAPATSGYGQMEQLMNKSLPFDAGLKKKGYRIK